MFVAIITLALSNHQHQEYRDTVTAIENKIGKHIQEGHSGQFPKEQTVYLKHASRPFVKQICEIGLNGGHSAALWLSAGNANVLMFDIGTHKYSHIAANILKEKYGDRFTVVFGNSLVTVPKTNVKCDIISVDGGHDFHTAYNDMKKFHSKGKKIQQ